MREAATGPIDDAAAAGAVATLDSAELAAAAGAEATVATTPPDTDAFGNGTIVGVEAPVGAACPLAPPATGPDLATAGAISAGSFTTW